MTTVANKSEALSSLGERLSSARIFSESDVQDILEAGLGALDECEEINGVYCYSSVDILNSVASAIWLRFYHYGHELQSNDLMTHAINGEC